MEFFWCRRQQSSPHTWADKRELPFPISRITLRWKLIRPSAACRTMSSSSTSWKFSIYILMRAETLYLSRCHRFGDDAGWGKAQDSLSLIIRNCNFLTCVISVSEASFGMTLIMTVKSVASLPPIQPFHFIIIRSLSSPLHPVEVRINFLAAHFITAFPSGVKHREWSEQSENDFPHRKRAFVGPCWRALCGFAILKLSIRDGLEHGRNFPVDVFSLSLFSPF